MEAWTKKKGVFFMLDQKFTYSEKMLNICLEVKKFMSDNSH